MAEALAESADQHSRNHQLGNQNAASFENASVRSLSPTTPSDQTPELTHALSPRYEHVLEPTEPAAHALKDPIDTELLRSLTHPHPTRTADEGNSYAILDSMSQIGSTAKVESSLNPEADHVEVTAQSEQSSPRASATSNLSNVNLEDEPPDQEYDIPGTEQESPSAAKDSARTISLSSITNALPSITWSSTTNHEPHPPPLPIPTIVEKQPAPTHPTFAFPTASAKKLSSAFSWLSRGSNSPSKDTLGSHLLVHRNTANSGATLSNSLETISGRLEEETHDHGVIGSGAINKTNTLKDRFRMARMRGESIAAEVQPATIGLVGRASSVDTIGGETEPESKHQTSTRSPASSVPPSAFGPGSPSDVSDGSTQISDSRVNWDLWQSVVYEGPAVVSRTSAEELKRAIANGIPSAIRGVIWQVLAQSKNEELALMYKQLSLKSADNERDRHSQSTTASNGSYSNLSLQGEQFVASSASSMHSDHSGPNGASSPIVVNEKPAEVALKMQAAAAAEKKKRNKEDALMLSKLEKTIRRDLGARTSFSKYAAAEGLQQGLFGICKAYALFDEEVGYAQGMNFIVMPLLFNMPEEEAFCLLVRLMQHYKLRDLFLPDMCGLHLNLYLFERLLEDFEPALYCHLRRRDISPHLYATQWFLTLFSYRFPLQLVLRIYDLILSEGLSAILRFGLVLMQRNAGTLRGISDMQQLTTFLKDRLFDVYIDKTPSAGSILENGFFGSSASSLDKEVYQADQLVQDACAIELTPDLVWTYTSEWKEKTKVENERTAELEGLRGSNANYAWKIRKLEERTEAADREQADLVTELVRTKVANQELHDQNEGLKGQVRELKLVIERQPEEIEQAWRLERDDLIARNSKVHEENQRLESDMQQLEDELVTTKLRWAELNSQHETLNRKWTDVRRQFD